ncbi:hypothetical protein [Neisseria gonorrhoeae]|uniref:hypothetical protein n=1 Tax=Neisseria gonorrhoeae TaxID=485 RepID=UPI0021D87824|nr:hypothetical protein [Neisseria gonorrhoeae]UYA81424.1 hypothetical protein LLE35_06105 [Neisseria gonorrhoeae]
MPTPTIRQRGYAGGYFGVDSGFCARGMCSKFAASVNLEKLLELESNLKPIDFKLLLD